MGDVDKRAVYIDSNGIERDCIILEGPRTVEGKIVKDAVAYIEVPSLTDDLVSRRATCHDAQVFRTYARWRRVRAPKDATARDTVGYDVKIPPSKAESAEVIARVEKRAAQKATKKAGK